MGPGRLSRRYLFISFSLCLWIVTLDAFPTNGSYSADQEWQHFRDSKTTLRDSTTIWAVACVYPVSGIYTRMQRLLVYAVTAFVFLLRSYEWLIAVGMTFVLTYASAACIHTFLLSALHGVGPDSDILALQGIIVTTTVAICCYSIGSRRISKYAIAPLFYMWISAMLVTSIAIFSSTNGILGNLATLIVPAGCSADGKCNPHACSNATSHGLFRNDIDQLVPVALEQWMYYNTSTLDGYYAPPEFCVDCHGFTTPLSIWYQRYFFLVVVCVMTRLVANPLLFNPSKSRNVVFLYSLIRRSKGFGTSFSRENVLWIHLSLLLRLSVYRFVLTRAGFKIGERFDSFLLWNVSIPSEVEFVHINAMKLLASSWFVGSWLSRILMLMLPVMILLLSELTLARVPESEAPRLVGQWAPFVYVGLALFASLILKFLNYRRVGVQEQSRFIYIGSAEPLSSPLRGLTEEYERNLDLNPYLIWKEFKVWWNDPMKVAKQDFEDVRMQILFELRTARRRIAKRRTKANPGLVIDEVTEPAHAELVERLEFVKIWERLSASASGSQNPRDWLTQIPSTFAICRRDHNGDSLVDTGWITAMYEEEEYEQISTAEIRRREAKFQRYREDREQLGDSLETFIGDMLEFGGFELREA